MSWTPIHEHERDAVLARRCGRSSPKRWPRLDCAVRELPSGAGHDAVTLSGLTDIAILFVRSTGGSHNPGESVTEADVALAIDVATRFACSI